MSGVCGVCGSAINREAVEISMDEREREGGREEGRVGRSSGGTVGVKLLSWLG